MLLPMKKLAILASLCIAAPVFACPGHDGDAPKTAEKAETPRTADAKTDKKTPDTAKKADPKQTDKKPDKVSSR